MKRYTAAELDLMANLVTSEMTARFADAVLHDQHAAAVRLATETGKPVQGVCATMFRNADRSRTDEDGIDCSDLVSRLRQHAVEVKQGGGFPLADESLENPDGEPSVGNPSLGDVPL